VLRKQRFLFEILNTEIQTNSIKIPTETRTELYAIVIFRVTDFVERALPSKVLKQHKDLQIEEDWGERWVFETTYTEICKSREFLSITKCLSANL